MRPRQANYFLYIVFPALIVLLAAGISACGQIASPTLSPAQTMPLQGTPTFITLVPTATPSLTPSLSPTLLPSPTPDCLGLPGTLEEGTMPTTHTAYDSLRFKVYLPPCYADRPDQRYPVLYLFHGLTSDETQWITIGATATADRLIGQGEVAPFIMVMPYDPSWDEPSDYHFHDAITEDLVPYIDAHYRTLADPSHRAVGGASRGSGWAIHLGLTRPDLFGAVGAHSMVVFASDWLSIRDWLAYIPRENLPRMYIDISVNDQGLWTAKQFEIILNDASIPHEFHLNGTGEHDNKYWSLHVDEYLRWYAAGWAATP